MASSLIPTLSLMIVLAMVQILIDNETQLLMAEHSRGVIIYGQAVVSRASLY